MKDARPDWRAHCGLAVGAGSGQPATSSERDRRARRSRPQDAVIFSAGRRRTDWVAPAAGGLAMRRRGPVCRGFPRAGDGNGAALQITALVAGVGSILHDTPRTKRIVTGGVAVRNGSRGPRCSGFWAGRLRREGGRDELACPARGQTDFASSASLPAFQHRSCPVLKAGSLARFVWVAGARAVLTSGWECGAPGRGSRVKG